MSLLLDEKADKIRQENAELKEKINNTEPRYLEGKKQFLLASNQESLQSLMDNQNAELTRVLIELKSEHDQLNLESSRIQSMINEYDKRIAMLQSADEAAKVAEEKQKENFDFMDKGIKSKKDRKSEEEFTKKSLLKQKEKLNRDIFVIQKSIIDEENESKNLDKKFERAAINENIIKEQKNKVYSKTQNQKQKNNFNKNENDLKIQQYKKIIELKSAFLKFSDERKEIQDQIAQQAKNDSQDKQEVEKRKTLKLLMLYNQYLRTLMDEELRENEKLEQIFEQIRDITGTNNLDQIVDFIVLRNKRYNYACHQINDCEEWNKDLKREIKELKKELVQLKNNLLVEEKDEKEIDVDLSTNIEEEKDLIEKEKQKNQNLLEIGKKYNEVDEAYQNVLSNISSMIENEKRNPLDVKIEESKKEEFDQENEEEQNKEEETQFELTNDEHKRFINVIYERSERSELDKFKLTEEEELLVKNAELTEKEKKDIEKNELSVLDKIVTRADYPNMYTEEEMEIMDEIENFQLTEEEQQAARDINLKEEEEKVATQRLNDEKEITEDKKKEKIDNFQLLKAKYEKYKEQEKKDNTKYKLLKMKKYKADMVKDYELLLKKVERKFDTLYLIYNKQEFINEMKQKQIADQNELGRSQIRKNTRKGTKKMTNRLPTNKRYQKTESYKIIAEDQNEEEEDKSNYEVDTNILAKFLHEQKKEKENFVSGKVKIEEKK